MSTIINELRWKMRQAKFGLLIKLSKLTPADPTALYAPFFDRVEEAIDKMLREDQQEGRRDDLGQRTDAGQRTGQRGRRQQRSDEAQQTVSEQLDEVRSRRSVLENSKHSDSPLGKTLAMRLASLAQDWRPSLLTP